LVKHKRTDSLLFDDCRKFGGETNFIIKMYWVVKDWRNKGIKRGQIDQVE